jgi:hypothetical protein
MSSGHCALARANRVFRADEKRIRTENTVMNKSKSGLGGLLSKIVDCARMCFSSAQYRNAATREALLKSKAPRMMEISEEAA